MKGLGDKFLEHSFKMLEKQTFKDFDVVISDHSRTGIIRDLCERYKNRLNIIYIKNEKNVGSSSANINNAIKNAKGKIIKILFQDDFLYTERSLENIVKNFDLENDKWLITACICSRDCINFYDAFYPTYKNNIHTSKNLIGPPSVLTVKNDLPLLFDENLIWRMDSDYYKRCFEKFGEPKIINDINIVSRIGPHQITNTLANDLLREKEYEYILRKYNEKFLFLRLFVRKVKRFIKSLINKK